MTDLKPEEFFIMTQAGSLPFNVVKTEGEAVEICAMIRRSNEPDFIHVIEHSAYAALKEENAKLRAERDAYAESMRVALRNGIYPAKESVRKEIARILEPFLGGADDTKV